MIKITVRELVQSSTIDNPAQTSPLSRIVTNKLRVSAAFLVQETLKAANGHVERYHALRKELFDKWGEDMEGGLRSIKEEHVKEFQAQMKELEETTVELPGRTINLSDFDSTATISPLDVGAVPWLFTQPEKSNVVDMPKKEDAEAEDAEQGAAAGV